MFLWKMCLSIMIISSSATRRGIYSKKNAWTHKTCESRKSRKNVHDSYLDIHVNTRHALCTLDEKFMSFSIDAIEMKRKFHCFSMKSGKLNALAKALSPAYLRVGGTPQDFATFSKEEEEENSDEESSLGCTPRFENWRKMKPYVLPLRYFDEIAIFSKRNGFQLIFGLNALTHRNKDQSWNEQLSLMLIDHARKNNMSVSWELGNEPNRYRKYGENFAVSPEQLAKDYKKLKKLIKTDRIVGPGVASRNPKALKFLKSVLGHEGSNVLDAITYHHYFMHQTVSTVQKYVNPVYLNQLESKMRTVRNAMLSTQTATDLWLGEAGTSSGGGAKNLSDCYASGFLYLGTLGLASKFCHKVVIRQSFYGGYYGMIDSITHDPLPDYWTSVLFKKLVGNTSLKVQSNNKFVHVQAYCNKQNSRDITLIVINFSKRTTTFSVPGFCRHRGVGYVLTADDIQSKVVRLNGEVLKLGQNNSLPSLNGKMMKLPFHLPKRSYGFFVVRNVRSKICQN